VEGRVRTKRKSPAPWRLRADGHARGKARAVAGYRRSGPVHPTPRMNRRWLIRSAVAIAGILLVVVVVRARTRGGAPSQSKNPEATRAVPVLTAQVVQRDVPVWLEGLGTVTAWQQVTVRSQLDGRLVKVFFQEGQAVKQGQLLAQIDPRPFLVQLHQ